MRFTEQGFLVSKQQRAKEICEWSPDDTFKIGSKHFEFACYLWSHGISPELGAIAVGAAISAVVRLLSAAKRCRLPDGRPGCGRGVARRVQRWTVQRTRCSYSSNKSRKRDFRGNPCGD